MVAITSTMALQKYTFQIEIRFVLLALFRSNTISHLLISVRVPRGENVWIKYCFNNTFVLLFAL